MNNKIINMEIEFLKSFTKMKKSQLCNCASKAKLYQI